MVNKRETDSRKLLGRLREVMADDAGGQTRLDQITRLIAEEMYTDVCSIYLFRDEETLELLLAAAGGEVWGSEAKPCNL